VGALDAAARHRGPSGALDRSQTSLLWLPGPNTSHQPGLVGQEFKTVAPWAASRATHRPGSGTEPQRVAS